MINACWATKLEWFNMTKSLLSMRAFCYITWIARCSGHNWFRYKSASSSTKLFGCPRFSEKSVCIMWKKNDPCHLASTGSQFEHRLNWIVHHPIIFILFLFSKLRLIELQNVGQKIIPYLILMSKSNMIQLSILHMSDQCYLVVPLIIGWC